MRYWLAAALTTISACYVRAEMRLVRSVIDVEEVDGSPKSKNINTIVVSNGSLTISGTTATVTTGAGGGVRISLRICGPAAGGWAALARRAGG